MDFKWRFKQHWMIALVNIIGVISSVGCASENRLREASMTSYQSRIIFIRHGEKPAAGLGQLNCQGLNRALALPDVLIPRFGKPHTIYAPNPGYVKPDRGGIYNYIRPLATIEPTAIRLGLPVNTQYGFDQTEALKKALMDEAQKSHQVWVVWEHNEIVNVEHALFKMLDMNQNPLSSIKSDGIAAWDSHEFNRIDIIDIHGDQSAKITMSYSKQTEDLNHLSEECPRIR